VNPVLGYLAVATGPNTASVSSTPVAAALSSPHVPDHAFVGAPDPITLSWGHRRVVIAVLRAKTLPYMRWHANIIERLLERHAADELMLALQPRE
jgi:hypothetical protein